MPDQQFVDLASCNAGLISRFFNSSIIAKQQIFQVLSFEGINDSFASCGKGQTSIQRQDSGEGLVFK